MTIESVTSLHPVYTNTSSTIFHVALFYCHEPIHNFFSLCAVHKERQETAVKTEREVSMVIYMWNESRMQTAGK